MPANIVNKRICFLILLSSRATTHSYVNCQTVDLFDIFAPFYLLFSNGEGSSETIDSSVLHTTMEDMEEIKSAGWSDDRQYYNNRHILSPEIVEIDDSKSFASSTRDGGNSVYVAVGKDDLDVLKWALNHAVLPGATVFLVHVFPPVNYIPTPIGKMRRSQASQDQVKAFLREENVRRQNLLQKYVRFCNDAKVTVETMLIESNQADKAILELIPVLNITMLVMGTKSPSPRKLRRGRGKGEFVQKNAPDFCEVIIIFDGKKVIEGLLLVSENAHESGGRRAGVTQGTERKIFGCLCFCGRSS